MADDERAFIHRVNPGRRGSRADLCYDDNVLITGFSEIPHAATIPTQRELQLAIKAAYPKEKPNAHLGRGAGLWRFFHEMTPGTLVVTPEDDAIHVARVTGPPLVSMEKSAIDSDTIHRIPVVWLTRYFTPPRQADASPALAKAAGVGTQRTTRRVDHLRADVEILLDRFDIEWRGDDPALEALIDKQYPSAATKRQREHTRGSARRKALRVANALADTADADDRIACEGSKVQYALHRSHERDRKIVAAKKKQVLDERDRLACEACNYDFASEWTGLGGPYIEAHHLIHISKGTRTTRLQDLALLCANCHRAIHRLSSGTSVSTLRQHVADGE